jgi:hypothetical protein
MKKNKVEREQELQRLASTDAGKSIIVDLYKQAKGIPPGTDPAGFLGTLIRTEMIPAILAHEYPNG